MRASLLQKRLHDINLDLFHVLVSTESAAQEASGMGTMSGQPLAAPFSALPWVSSRCKNVCGRQMQRYEYESCIYIARGKHSWLLTDSQRYTTNLRIRSKNKHSSLWTERIGFLCSAAPLKASPWCLWRRSCQRQTLDTTSTQPPVLFWFPLLLSPDILFITCLFLLPLLLWMFGQHMWTVYTHTHTQGLSHSLMSPQAHVCDTSSLPVHTHSPADTAAPHLPCWGPLQWLQAWLLGCTLTGSFLSIWCSLQTALQEHPWLPCPLTWSHTYVCLGKKWPSSVLYIKTCMLVFSH